MPVDVVRLDESFIDDIRHGRQRRALVEAISWRSPAPSIGPWWPR